MDYFSSGVTGRNEIWKIPSAGGFIASESPDVLHQAHRWERRNRIVERRHPSRVRNRAGAIYYIRQEHGDEASIRRFVPPTRQDSRRLGHEPFISLSRPQSRPR